jgi:ribosome biogenesis GTPase
MLEETPAMADRKTKHWRHVEEQAGLRLVRKQIKRNREPAPVRRKDWIVASPDNLDAYDELDAPQRERVMPRGERERRQKIWTAALNTVRKESEQPDVAPAEEMSGPTGMVVEVSMGLCRVRLDGRELLCTLRGSLSAHDTGLTNVVAVGDRVIVSEDGTEQGVVEAVLPRRSALSRPDSFYTHLQQVIVANADQVLVVASWREPAFWPELVDRYLIGAERSNLAAILCVNKIDLAEDAAECRKAMQPYLDTDVQVLFTSAATGEGVGELRDVLRGRMTVLSGMSGVGKSSLLNAVQPGLNLRASHVSERKHEGRHTTTQVTLVPLEMGGHVADTPGVREWGLGGLGRAELVGYYPEFADAARACRFGNCSHIGEPGCAVRIAVQQGRAPRMRYESYRKIYESLST